ncbi:MAG TPA: hypothetical protein VGE50_05335 [Gammaproteobacteria bacterium]
MVAPLLAPVLSAASSYLASKGMDLLSGIFKGGIDKGVDKVVTKLKEVTGIDVNDIADQKVTEEDLVKLKQFEMDHQQMLLDHFAVMKEKELEEERIHQQDRSSARQMQMEALHQDDQVAKRFIYAYSFLITMLTFGYIFYITQANLAPSQMRIADTVLGFLLGVSLSAIIQFFYGSSKGSSDKNMQISKLTHYLATVAEEKGGAK